MFGIDNVIKIQEILNKPNAKELLGIEKYQDILNQYEMNKKIKGKKE